MPWLETVPMEERLQFIRDAASDHFTMAALCARYGVSRRIGYKWLARYEEEGRRGLADRSRAPHHCPHRIDDALAELLCTARRAHPDWGARKLLKVLTTRHARVRAWPAPSTVADLLARRGLVQSAAGAGCISILAWCGPPRPRRTISGPPTSRASTARAIGSTAFR